jgi:hypothetical protein
MIHYPGNTRTPWIKPRGGWLHLKADNAGEPPLTQPQADLVAAILAPCWNQISTIIHPREGDHG